MSTSFFGPDPDLPEPEPGPRTPAWFGPPSDEIPAMLAAPVRLATTQHAAVMLIGAHVHREGVELRIERRLRRRDLDATGWHRLLGSMGGHWSPEPTEGRMRFGVVLADGTRIVDSDAWTPDRDPFERPDGPVLRANGGGGGGGEHEYAMSDGLWLWPLPPEGPLELVVQWADAGIGETRTTLDGTAIVALARAAEPLWPEDA